jgi:hypothetical protein
MGTANLDFGYIATNSAAKEVQANATFDEIDGALASQLAKAMSDADYTLNVSAIPSEATGYLTYAFTGTLTANRNIIVPTNKKLYAVWNNSTSPYTLTVKTSGGTGVAVAYSSTAQYLLVYCDGTNVVAVGAPSAVPADPTINNQTASYTAELSDDGNIVVMNVAAANNFTVPPNSSVAFSVGATLTIIQSGAGQTTLVAGVGVTINTPSSLTARAQYSTVSMIQIATNVWNAAGDLT